MITSGLQPSLSTARGEREAFKGVLHRLKASLQFRELQFNSNASIRLAACAMLLFFSVDCEDLLVSGEYWAFRANRDAPCQPAENAKASRVCSYFSPAIPDERHAR